MIAPTTPEAARRIAENLRDDDRHSLAACEYQPAAEAYETAIKSPFSWVVYAKDGEPVSMFGAERDPGVSWGLAWMFTTPNSIKAPREIVTGVLVVIDYSRRFWAELRISHEPRSVRQMRFLAMVGFKEVSRYEENGMTFIEMAV